MNTVQHKTSLSGQDGVTGEKITLPHETIKKMIKINEIHIVFLHIVPGNKG